MWLPEDVEGRQERERYLPIWKVNFLHYKKLLSTKLEHIWKFRAKGPMEGEGRDISDPLSMDEEDERRQEVELEVAGEVPSPAMALGIKEK